MKYTETQLKEKILQIMNGAKTGDSWQEEIFELLRSQVSADWSGEIAEGACMEDLDAEAVKKAGVLPKTKITKAELLLLGKAESAHLLDGFVPRITWTRYDEEGNTEEQEHFGMPLLLAVDKLCAKINNITYTYETDQISLFPDTTEQYDTSVIKIILNNLIAHNNYQLQGRIRVKEFADKLELVSEGTYLPKYMRDAQQGEDASLKNAQLSRTMVNVGLLDGESADFSKVEQIQCEKGLPLPNYDLEIPNRIQITLYGKVLDKNYTRLLTSRDDLDLRTIFLLDKVQKKEEISKEDYQHLRKKELVEGRYPNIFVSYKIAGATGLKTNYVKNKGLGDDVYKKVLINALKTMGSANVRELFGVLKGALPEVMDKKQQNRKISNLLQGLKKQGVVKAKGTGQSARWYLVDVIKRNEG